MRASDLTGKTVIDLGSGAELGLIKETELLLDLTGGTVEGLVLLKHGWGGRRKEIKTIPWRQVRKIGANLVIVETEESAPIK